MFKINYVPSTSHLIFYPIILKILAVLLIMIVVERFIKCKKEKKPFINLKNYSFFVKNYDKLRLWGFFVFLVLYVFLLPIMGFLPASILFVLIFNILFVGIDKIKAIPNALKGENFLQDKNVRSIFVSLLISVISSVFVWFMFGKVFFITLP